MFIDDEDKRYFLELFDRYLAEGRRRNAQGRAYVRLFTRVRVVTFALMPNHFHLIVFQLVPGGAEDLMNRVLLSYTKYFNARHGRQGSMFAGPYRSDHKADRRSQLNAIAYVHDNHGDSCDCDFCGHKPFADPNTNGPAWLDVERGLAVFGDRNAYLRFRAGRHSLRDVTAASHA